MTKKQEIQLFEEKKVRTVWDPETEQWYFCVVDVVEVLTDSVNPNDYIKKMKKRDPSLAEGWGQIVSPLSVQTQGGKQSGKNGACPPTGTGEKSVKTSLQSLKNALKNGACPFKTA